MGVKRRYHYWLGCDPGTANFAYSVVRYCTQSGKTKLLEVGMIECPIKNLTDNAVRDKKRRGKAAITKDEPTFQIGMELFNNEIESLFDKYPITHFVGERFMTRGLKGDTIESVSIMLGVILLHCMKKGIDYRLVSAGVWKGAVSRLGGDLAEGYKYAKMLKMEAHPLDATMMALHYADKNKQWLNNRLVERIVDRLVLA